MSHRNAPLSELGRATAPHSHRRQRLDRNSHVGSSYLHNAVDDHSSLAAYSEILGDERKETAVAFWQRARNYFADNGIASLSPPRHAIAKRLFCKLAAASGPVLTGCSSSTLTSPRN
ncbi:hypothetical protein ACFWPX_03800 [Nocardia sp. NPDC058518]|uniref:hypothetical protein n=1 Tax=Nocardia sp. NPDC058518 TaxID=3346534 RepID=UPI003667E799